ncbi:MAG: tetratricopeptide repeat protein [bacterium]|nr:tetratricopeptide repeat protein [bacterium]
MRLFSSFLLSLCLIQFSFSQQSKIDSLTIEFNKATIDTVKTRLLKEIGEVAYYVNRDIAKQMNDSLISFSKGKSQLDLAAGYKMKGTLTLLDGDYDKAEEYYSKSLKIAQEIKHQRIESAIYGNFGTLYGRKRELEKSKEFYLKSIELNNKIGNELKNENAYLNLGITAEQQDNLIEATEYFIKTLEISEKNDNSRYVGYSHMKLGTVYVQLNRFIEAEEHLSKALQIQEEIEDNYGLSVTHNSFGYLYESRDDDFKQALYHYEKSLYYNKLLNNKSGQITSYFNIALQHIRFKNFDKAKFNNKEGLKLSDSLNSAHNKIVGTLLNVHLSIEQDKLRDAYDYLNLANQTINNGSKLDFKNHFFRIATAFENKKVYKPAYENMHTYALLADSLFNNNGVERIAEIETKYQTEKKEKENLQLKTDKAEQELQLEKENKRKWYFAIGLLASLLTLGVFGFYYRRNKKQKEIIENLQKDLHHRVKNNLAIIDSLIDDIKDEFDNEKFKTKLVELQNRIDSINEVHSQLYMNTDITNLKLNKYVEKLAHNVQQSFAKENITIENDIDDSLTLHVDKSFPVGLIINEFLTNSFKYAFTDNEQGTVNVSIKEKPQTYLLSLTDNGKGLPKDFDISKLDSFGVDVMQLLSKQLKGTFSLDGTKGVKLNIEFPKA